MTFANEADYDKIEQMDELSMSNLAEQIKSGVVKVQDVTKDFEFEVKVDLSQRQREMLEAGGLLNYTKNNA